MAIIEVLPLKGKRSAGMDATYRRTFSKQWRVLTDDPGDEGPIILAAVDPSTGEAVPQVGTTYYATAANQDLGAFVQGLDAQEEEEDGLSWVVTATYGPYDAAAFAANPVDWPVKVTFTGQMRERILYFDRDGDPILNSAGEPFADPITTEDPRYTITVTRNELVAAFDLTLASEFGGTLNAATWNGFAAETVKLGIITTGEPTYDSNAQAYYYAVTYPFEVNPDGWARGLLDQGFCYRDGSNKLVPFLDKGGQKLDEPQLLNGSGAALAFGGTPVTLTFDTVPTADWSVLNLDFNARLGV